MVVRSASPPTYAIQYKNLEKCSLDSASVLASQLQLRAEANLPMIECEVSPLLASSAVSMRSLHRLVLPCLDQSMSPVVKV